MLKKTSLILVSILTLLNLSCADDEEENISTNDLGISQEIKDLIYFTGDEMSDTVLINVQSGPDTELATVDIDLAIQNFNTVNFLTVNVHQAQTRDPGLISNRDITFDEAIAFDLETVEILSQVITYFKKQNRTVYVFGQSFGAFVTQDLIARNGIDIADGYLIMIGRLDMNDVIWQGLSEGRYGFFENGINPILENEIPANVIERNLAKLAAGFGKNRYTQLLNSFEDLSKITYVYGKTDEVVGSLTATEDQFLVSKNAKVLAGNGGHDQTLSQFFFIGFQEAFGIE